MSKLGPGVSSPMTIRPESRLSFNLLVPKPANHFSGTWPKMFSCVAMLCGIADTSPIELNAPTSKLRCWFGSFLTLCLFCFLPLWCLASASSTCLVLCFFYPFYILLYVTFFFVCFFVCLLPCLSWALLVSWVFMFLLCFLLNKV